MRLQALRDAKFNVLNQLATGPWQRATAKLTGAGDKATGQVGGKIRGGSWEGFSGTVAGLKAQRMEEQLDAAVTEASAIKWLMWEAAREFIPLQQKVNELIKAAQDHPYFKVDSDGVVSIDTDGTKALNLTSPRSQGRASTLNIEAGNRTHAINEVLKKATELDVRIAKALLAATNLDDGPFDPNFNANAAKDGFPGFDPSVGGKEWAAALFNNLKKGLGEQDGTPAEQSAAVGAKTKSLVEKAGGVCKMFDGMMVCVGAPSYMHKGGGVTYGDTFVSPYASFDDLEARNPPGTRNGLIDHERYHRDHQWRKYGYEFGPKYLVSKIPPGDDRPSGEIGKETDANGKPGPELNRWEWDAEHYGGDGHYPGGHGG